MLLFGLLLCHLASPTDVIADAAAKVLAGLPLRGTPLESRDLDPEWATHATVIDHVGAVSNRSSSQEYAARHRSF